MNFMRQRVNRKPSIVPYKYTVSPFCAIHTVHTAAINTSTDLCS